MKTMEQFKHQLEYRRNILSEHHFQPTCRILFQLVAFLILFLIPLLLLPSMSLAEEDTWTTKADMPTARGGLSTSVVNGKIYAFGGWRISYLPQVEVYDPLTDTWTKRADMPIPRHALATSVVKGKIYVIGGSSGGQRISRVDEYDPTADTWTQKTDMPTPRSHFSASAVNGKIYAIGGSGAVTAVEEYDPATDTWTKKADMPTWRSQLSTSAVNGKIYAIGGWAGNSLRTVEEYDPATDTWTRKADLPTPIDWLSTSVVNGKIYAINDADVVVYDPVTDTWTRKADKPTPTFGLSVSAANGIIYAIGGYLTASRPGFVSSSTVEAYDTGVGIWVTRISPQDGLVTGGEAIEIFGSGFPNDAIVTIGENQLTELKPTDTLITGITPPGIAGKENILITAPSIDFTVFAGTFIYRPISDVVITSITPTNGKQTGGDAGSIVGRGFLEGATVTIGGNPAEDVRVVEATLITFTIPPGAEGAKDVVVTNPDGQKWNLYGGYTYNPFPEIEAVEPNRGGVTGRTKLRIRGNHFIEGIVVIIGAEQIRHLDFFSTTELQLRTPAGSIGPKAVQVINPDGQVAILERGFTYEKVPIVVEGAWTMRAYMPTARLGLRTSVVNGKIYAIGGYADWIFGPILSTVEQYDPAMDTWTKKTDMPTPRGELTISVVNGKIYAIGGWSGHYISTVEEYNPATDTWMTKTDMPTRRSQHAASIVNGKIYAIGGFFLGSPLPVVEEYDPVTDTWAKKTDMPTPRGDVSASAVDGKIYVIGGWAVGSGLFPTVEEYDPATDTWTKRADIPTPRSVCGISVVDGKIYVIGGDSPSTVEEYNPVTDTWTRKADLPTPRKNLSASAVNGYIYAIGGHLGNPGLSTVEAYDTGVGIRVRSISPQDGPVAGGGAIAIFGRGFPPEANVTIGGNQLTELKLTDTLITGIIPPGTEGEKKVLITAPSIDFAVFAGTFIYTPPSQVIVTRITPTNGKQAGGDTGSITGNGFMPGATVTISGTPVTNVVVTSTLITFTIPPGTEGAKDVAVINPDGQEGILPQGYTYNPFPIIEDIEPNEGPRGGGTQITITGNHFIQGVAVTIGDERIPGLDFFSPIELRLKTPAGTTGAKEVRVVNPDGQDAVLKDGFTYNPGPSISSVSPNMGPLEGGTAITIIGTGFLSKTDVLIGGAEALSEQVMSPTKIKVETPPSNAGIKDVVVINRDGQQVTLEKAFTYNPAPVITKVIPDNGKLAGGTKITIRGRGFLPKAKVLIRTGERSFASASSIQVMSPVLITAVTPSGEPGPKDVVIRNPDRQEIILPGGFTYNPIPRITEVSPDHGPASGGAKIIVRGAGFMQGAKVIIGKRAATTEILDDSTIEAVTPANPQGTFDVRVINPDTQEAVKRKGFISVGELAYNYPNPFRAEQGTTFRYVTNERVELIKVQIFNMGGVPIGVVGRRGSNEVRWYDATVHAGLYVYLMEVRLEGGKVKRFKRALEVYK